MSKKKKVKAEIDEQGRISFLSDEDGVSERDYLILITSVIFFGGIGLGLVITIVGMFLGFELPQMYIELIKTMDIVVTTIVGGLFAVKATQTIVSRKTENGTEKDITIENSNSTTKNNDEDVYL